MEVFKILNGFDGHALHFVYDRASHLRAIVAVDSLVDGLAVGGIRNLSYASEEDAIEDACSLARTMSFKAALAGLRCGGAKTVIYRHPNMKRAQAYRALGRAIESLGGSYHAGGDIGTTVEDLACVASETGHVAHRLEYGRHAGRGVLAAIRATMKALSGSESLKEVRVAIQGLGEVGMELAGLLSERGTRLVVADPIKARCTAARRRFAADIVAPESILSEPCDLLAPCARGGIITERNLPRLGCHAIVGCANNILVDPALALELKRQDVVFVPDFVSSAGALIIGVTELLHGKAQAKPALVDRIHGTTLKVLNLARERGVPPLHAAETLAARALKRM